MEPETRYELKLSNGQLVTWIGRGHKNAAFRYLDSWRVQQGLTVEEAVAGGPSVIAWRKYREVGVFILGNGRIIG